VGAFANAFAGEDIAMITKVFLALVGGAYLALAAWCAAQPERTSTAVGFTLKPGAGQSEYFTVYGGLQLALALVFLWPLVDAGAERYALTTCLIVHACLVLMRSMSLVLYAGIPTATYGFAAVEWAILLLAAWRYWAMNAGSAS
jgi:hypothetical protein